MRIDSERCQGHTMCVLGCPEMFLVNDEDGHAYVADEAVPREHEASVRAAALSCPEGAIEVFET